MNEIMVTVKKVFETFIQAEKGNRVSEFNMSGLATILMQELSKNKVQTAQTEQMYGYVPDTERTGL